MNLLDEKQIIVITDEIIDEENLKKKSYNYLEDYNNFYPSRKMNLILFMNAI